MSTIKYNIICNKSKKSILINEELKSILNKSDFSLDKNNYEYLFIIGGDGTFLKSLKYFDNKKIIGINGGNLGYFSFFDLNNINSILFNVQNNKNFKNINLLKIKIGNNCYFCLNELFINCNQTLQANVYINNTKLEKFKGTGILISTPFGSTAHNKSAGGAIVDNNLDVIQLLFIHPICQKKYSSINAPLILNNDAKLMIELNSSNNFSIVIDGNLIDVDNNQKIFIESIKSKFKLYWPNEHNLYIDKLRNSFIKDN